MKAFLETYGIASSTKCNFVDWASETLHVSDCTDAERSVM